MERVRNFHTYASHRYSVIDYENSNFVNFVNVRRQRIFRNKIGFKIIANNLEIVFFEVKTMNNSNSTKTMQNQENLQRIAQQRHYSKSN